MARKRRKPLVVGSEDVLSDLRRQVSTEFRTSGRRAHQIGATQRGPMVQKMLEAAERVAARRRDLDLR